MKKSDPLWVKCDKLCREIVKVRDGRKCRVCGNPSTDTVHIIDRDVAITRCDPTNLYAGCRLHHDHNEHNALIIQHIMVVGEPEYFRLLLLSQKLVTYRRPDLIDIAEKLKAELRFLKENEN